MTDMKCDVCCGPRGLLSTLASRRKDVHEMNTAKSDAIFTFNFYYFYLLYLQDLL